MRGATHTQHTAPKKPGCSYTSSLPPTSRQLAPLVPPNSSPHSYRKPQLPFFLTPTENPQLPFFFARTTTRLVIRYSAQIRERDVTPSRKMESADPSAKKMRLPPAATPVVDPAPGSAGRSGDPAPTGSQEPVESRVDRISDLPDAVLGEIISLLPTKDCCRTQVLSIRWRPLWRAVPLNLDCRQLSLFNDFEIPRAIISSHQGSVQSLCIPSCYLSKHTMPCTVDAWLKSPEFTELQLLEFYYSPGNHIPHTERHELVPSAPMSISRFSSSLHTATFALCYLPDNLVLNLRLPFLKKLSLVRVRISEASLHSIIHSSCLALERLLIVLGIEIGISCLQIKSPHLKTQQEISQLVTFCQ